MGLFDKLFEKKICDICGGEIGLLGNRKLSDGNMCKECAKKLSPNLEDRKELTIAQINEHLAYREENQRIVDSFNPTRILGEARLLIIDEEQQLWLLSSSTKFQGSNPDVLTYDQVLGAETSIDESRREIKKKDEEGKEISYIPPRYEYSFNFYVTVRVRSPWFSEFKIRINNFTVEGRNSSEYQQALTRMQDMASAFEAMRLASKPAEEEKQEEIYVTCPFCRATTLLTASRKCEYCGGALE